jgi:hypothetical protein
MLTALDRASLAHSHRRQYEADAEAARLRAVAAEACDNTEQAATERKAQEDSNKRAEAMTVEFDNAVADGADDGFEIVVNDLGDVVARRSEPVE